MKDNEYIGYIEGYIATTNIDSHGDKLTPQAIESMATQLNSNPELRVLYYNHDMTQPMGYITECSVETKGEWSGLKARAGIYKNRPDLWQKMQSGEISGFSYGAKILATENSGLENGGECSFSIEVDPTVSHEVSDMLSQMGINIDTVVRKSADFPTILTVVTSLLNLPIIIYALYKLGEKFSKGNQAKKDYLKIKTTTRVYNFKDNTCEEIINEIETIARR